MGKVSAAAAAAAEAATTEMKRRKKKKGRPSLIDLQKRNLLKQQQEEQQQQKPPIITSSSSPNLNRRSTRRNPSPELGDDDDDERKEKKVKLVVRLPQLIQQQRQHFDDLHKSSSLNSVSGASDSDDEGDNPGASSKKRKINAVTDRSEDNIVTDQEEKVTKVTDTLNGSPLDSGPTTPLPDKKLLAFILDRLQKKDTYGVFSEPVDPNELPDYHEIIEHPMDFGTVRRKLDAGLYLNLEQLEADVFLICSNAMQYNSSDTIYFRQARSIQDLAKRDFENLRHEGDDGELHPKVVRRGRPPSKHLKKPIGSTSVDRIGPELSSGATLATGDRPDRTGEDNTNGSNAYNLRRAPPVLYRFQSPDAILNSHRSRNGENYSEWLADWNDEFPASILRADMKYGKKQFSIDETRRDTYKQFHPSAFGHEPSLLSDLGGNTKQLMPVGLHMEHSYARSLARFALNLGPVVWKIASKKLENVLPPGMKFGPGFVGENEAPLQPPFFSFEKQRSSHKLASDGNQSRPATPSTSGVNPVVPSGFQAKDDMVEVDRRLSSQNEVAVPRSAPFPEIRPGLIHTRNKPVFNPDRNGFNGLFGYNFPSQTGLMRQPAVTGQSGPEEASPPSQIPGMVPKIGSSSTHSALKTDTDSEEHKYSESVTTLHSGNLIAPNTGSELHKVTEAGSSGRPSWKALSPHPRQYSLPVQPDLNVRLQGPGSPSSGLRVGSPQQPDLALQL